LKFSRLLQQHDARRDILTEPAARRRAAIEARGHSELGAQSGRKNQPACLSSVCLSVTFVHTTQPVEIFGNVSTPFGTLAIL